MRMLRLASILLLAGALAACGDDDSGSKADATPGGPDADVNDTDGGNGADAGDDGEWKVLNEGSWTIPAGNGGPGGDQYYCIYKTIEEDTYIQAFKGMIPLGTHHTVLTIYEGDEPDGIRPCSSGSNGPNMIYGTGVGTPEMKFPPGVAVKLRKGQRILNNLHLFNATDSEMTGVSGTYYKPIAASEVVHEAELVLAGPTFTLNVPAGVSTQKGNCQVSSITNEPIQVFSVAPHMHQLGTHMKSVLVRGGQETVIMDVDYNFDEQTYTLKDPFVELRPGDVLRTECTYNNTTGGTVRFGDGSFDEMCFTDIFYFPKQGATFICTGP